MALEIPSLDPGAISFVLRKFHWWKWQQRAKFLLMRNLCSWDSTGTFERWFLLREARKWNEAMSKARADLHEQIFEAQAALVHFQSSHGRTPTPDELREHLG